MAKFTRIEVALLMKETGLVPLFYHSDIAKAKEIVKACYEGGARVIEFTARGDFANEIFSELAKFIQTKLPEMAIGIGSITDAAMASYYMMLGADFIVTPSLREDIAKVCNRRKVLYTPGCASLTEIASAEELGCEIVKLFPGSSLGPDFVKAIKGPCPWTSVMVTGGVTTEEDNLKKWFEAGVTSVGIGSQLISKEILKSENFNELSTNVEYTMSVIKKIKK